MTILEKISAEEGKLTPQEARILRLIKRDSKSFALTPIGEVAEELQISKTTLVRFAKSAGFKGYADFKKQLQREVLLSSSPASKMQEIMTRDYSLSSADLCKHEQANIQDSYDKFDKHDLEKTVSLLVQADEVYTLSWGISGHLAEMFTVRCRLLGMRCSMLKRHLGTLLEESAHLKKNDVAILFEFPPYSIEVFDTVSRLAERGVKIVVVTDSENCPCLEFAETSFLCRTDTLFFGNSFVAPLFWVNLITSLVMDSNKKEALVALNRQQEIFNKKQYYHQIT